MQRGQRATNTQHKGVQIVRKGTKLILRFKDPIQGRYRDQTLGEVTRGQAVDAAVAKKAHLDAIKLRFITGDLAPLASNEDPIEDFIQSAEAKGTAAIRSLAAKYLRQLQSTMGTRSWGEIHRSDLLRLNSIVTGDKHLSPNTINLRLRTCRRFFTILINQGKLGAVTQDTLRRSINYVKGTEHKHGRILSSNELNEVLSVLLLQRKDAALFCLLAILTGARPGELVQIKGSDVILDTGVPHLKIFSPKTNRSRKINLTASPLAERILSFLSSTNNGYLWFPTETKDRDPVSLYRKFSKILTRDCTKKLGRHVSLKDYRSTNEALLSNIKGWDIFRVARQLGHSVAIAERNYTEDIQMTSFPEGKHIEDVAGITAVGKLILQSHNYSPELEKGIISKQTLRSIADKRNKINASAARMTDYLKDNPEDIDALSEEEKKATQQMTRKDVIREYLNNLPKPELAGLLKKAKDLPDT